MLSEVEFLVEGQQLSKLHDKILAEVSREYGLNKTELLILMFLSDNPQKDTAKEIVECRMLTKSCVSKSIDSLVRQGYLTTREDEEDRRILHLFVQKSAERAVEAGKAARADMSRCINQGISDEEREVFLEIWNKMMRNIREALNAES